jgi:RNA-binding protein 8A
MRSEGRKIKGRGNTSMEMEDRYAGKSGVFERLAQSSEDTSSDAPARSIEGWIIIITGVHEEAQEDNIHDKFADFGEIKNIHLPLDRRTGFVKGYALVEYETKKEAKAAIDKMNGAEFMGEKLNVDWAFSTGPHQSRNKRSMRKR